MNKIFHFLILFSFIISIPAFSQDIIYKKDGSKEEIKVLGISDKEISYKKISDPEGPTYTINRDEVLKIDFKNETQPPPAPEKEEHTQTLTKDYRPNIISYHFFDVVFGDITFSYERIIAQGKFGIKFPVSVGFYAQNIENSPMDFTSVYYSGVTINFYPTGQGKVRYFIGYSIRAGSARFKSDYDNYSDSHSDSYYMKYMIDNGLMVTPVKNFSLEAIMSVGLRYASSTYHNNSYKPTAQFAINAGFRF